MRPLKLVMQAFGPFAERQEIDFSSLQELEAAGPILIAGPTGSGKTMIFDAMSYALYGESSGSSREVRTLRSDFASPEVETVVTLDFALSQAGQTQIYQVTRQPQQEVWSPRVQRCVMVPSQVGLTLPDGTKLTKIQEVAQRISELIGLDAKQFKQTALLAQGEFQKLLYASSKERVEIFRTLFATDQARDFQDALQQKTEAKRSAVVAAREGLYRRVLGLPRREALAPVLAALQEDLLHFDTDSIAPAWTACLEEVQAELEQCREALKTLASEQEQQAICERRYRKGLALIETRAELQGRRARQLAAEEQRQAERERLAWLSHYQQLQTLLHDHKMRRAALAEWEEAEREIKRRERALAEAEEKLKQALVERPTQLAAVAELKAELTRLLDLEAELQGGEGERQEMSRAREEQERAANDLARVEGQLKHLGAQLRRRQALEAELAALARGQGTLTEENVHLDLLHQLTADLSERYGDWAAHVAKLRSLEAETDACAIHLAEQSAELERARAAQDQSWAVHLAAALVPDQPCPVCGSMAHPQPATGESVRRAEEVDALQLAVIGLKTQQSHAEMQQEQLRVEITSRQERYDQAQKLLQERFQTVYPDSLASPFFEDFFAAIPAMVHHLPPGEALELDDREGYEEALGQLQEAFAKLKGRAELRLEAVRRARVEAEEALRPLAVAGDLEALEAHRVEAEEALVAARAAVGEMEVIARERLARLSKLVGESVSDEAEAMASVLARREAVSERLQCLEQQLAAWTAEEARWAREAQAIELWRKQQGEQVQQQQQALERTEAEISAYVLAQGLELLPFYETDLTAAALAEAQEELRARLSAADLEQRALAEAEAQNLTSWTELALQETTPEAIQEKLQAIVAELAHKAEVRDQLGAKRQHLQAEEQALMDEREPLFHALSDLAEAEAIYEAHRHLQQVAMGQVAQSAKIDFETFVQTFYFQQVLQLAARRFSLLTEARYELRRRTEGLDLRKRVGLDLDVYDRWTGKSRPVATLSGGESFKAALAFALALSDLAGANAGGKKIGCLFIDEGFGTLDPDSLNAAYECLLSISDADRVVAVISHVPELAERLQKQIRVHSTPNGASQIDLVS